MERASNQSADDQEGTNDASAHLELLQGSRANFWRNAHSRRCLIEDGGEATVYDDDGNSIDD